MHTSLDDLRFDNSFARALPADPDERNHPRHVRGACFTRVAPTPVDAPRLVALSPEAARLLDLDPAAVDRDHLARVLSGNRVLPQMEPYAACYGGHQFGNWAGQLGDGRAIGLGEVVNRRGERWELQLKGAGPTPYSRMGDGRAVMRSSVREFLCSEAMYHLGVPTTRALSLVDTGERVMRDMFYDGNPEMEPGAVVCRLAPTFLRFGSFEILAARGEHDLLKGLADYALRTHFPHLGEPSPDTCAAWLAEVCERTARMVVEWMRVGFVHGVMNTDNMSILGLTMDYGPYGWLEGWDPHWTPNTTDAQGRRYRFGNQPRIALWNLVRFANALAPLVEEAGPLEQALSVYGDTLERERQAMMAAKLGLAEPDDDLADDLFRAMSLAETDMTLLFRGLADVPSAEEATDEERLAPVAEAWYGPDEVPAPAREAMAAWLRRYATRLREEGRPDAARREAMNRVNPLYVLRNWLAQLAIDDLEQGDAVRLHELLDTLRRPYDEQPGREHLATKRPEWARHRAGCSMLSCSS